MNKPLWLLTTILWAVPAFGQNQPTDLRMAAGCGPASAQFSVKVNKSKHEIVQPEAGKSLVYVIVQEIPHPGQALYIGNITTRVGADGTWVGANYGESYISFQLEPGEHRICADWQSSRKSLQKLSSASDLTAEVGKTYYFVLELRTGVPMNGREDSVFPAANLKLKAVDGSEGMLLVSRTGQSNWELKKGAQSAAVTGLGREEPCADSALKAERYFPGRLLGLPSRPQMTCVVAPVAKSVSSESRRSS
jgi:hypothetical protein